LGEVFNVAAIQSSHRNAPIAGHVYVCLFGEGLGLWGCKTGETEHADLALDVAPFTWGLEVFLKGVVKLLSHADDTVSHSLDLCLPLNVKFPVAQDGVGDSGTVNRGVGVHGSDDDL